uniref:WD_REPEATS_REGION domain-containing protein n=1 Tax=Syphacia muris TaxID=451379 RepID=A0A0N5ABJ2_9BILA
MRTNGYIVVCGNSGLLKIIKLDDDVAETNVTYEFIKPQPFSTPPKLAVNQNLEGHGGNVEKAVWNETYQKLTSSDSNGLIIVWLIQNGNWFEEMINNRNKSRVVDMAWNSFGTKIAIAYKDGIVVTGAVNGNGLWTKKIEPDICAICVSP